MTDVGARGRAHDAGGSVRARAAAAGLHLAEPDLAAVSAFLEALGPGLAALAEIGSQPVSDSDDHDATPGFQVEWR